MAFGQHQSRDEPLGARVDAQRLVHTDRIPCLARILVEQEGAPHDGPPRGSFRATGFTKTVRRCLRTALRRLDRPGTRPVYAAVMSVLTTWRRRELWWLRYRGGLWLHHTRRGVIPWPTPHPPDDLLTGWRDETLDYFCWAYAPKPGDTVVDVGAGIGSEIPTWVELTGGTGRVVAIEAHPTSWKRLAALVKANDYEVALVQAAVADRNGTVTISDRAEEIMNSILGKDVGPRVEARTLDEILATHGVSQVDFLKMNIEGAERLAIAGMTKSIKTVRQAVIACHDFLADQERRPEMRTKDEIRAFLVDNGFTVLERPDDGRPWVVDCLYATASASRRPEERG